MSKLLPTIACMLAVLLGCALPAQDRSGGEDQAVAAGQDGGSDTATRTEEMSNSDFFLRKYGHMVPHPLGDHGGGEGHVDYGFTFYNVNATQIFVVLLLILLFLPVRGSFGRDRVPILVRVLRGWCLWIRDEMVYAVMGRETGRQFLPYFLFVFFFVTGMNVIGLIPSLGSFGGFEPTGVTATATFWVTGTLAATTFVLMLGMGMAKQGVAEFWINLLPHGLPAWLIPLMAVVELIGLCVKPFALMVRLFATMLAGHLVVYSFLGMIFLFAKMSGMSPLAYVLALPSLGMMVFINVIESFIVLLQGYIFTYLSIIFIQGAMHPTH